MDEKDKAIGDLMRRVFNLCKEYCKFLGPSDLMGALEFIKMTIGYRAFCAYNEAAKEKEGET